MAKSSDVGILQSVRCVVAQAVGASVVVRYDRIQLSALTPVLWTSVLSIYIVAECLSEVVAAIGRLHAAGEPARRASEEGELLDLAEEVE